MEVLGNLGIDWWLIVAQILNFVLLLWLLKKLVYVPILRRLEKEEKDRRDLEAGLRKLEDEKKQLLTDRGASLSESKKRSEEILEEAERIAEEVKQTTVREAEDARRILLSRAEEEIKTLKQQVSLEEKKKLEASVRERLKETVARMRDTGTLGQLQRKYTDPMIEEIKNAPFADPGHIERVDIEYGAPVDTGDIDRMKSALRDKVGHDIATEVKERTDLIAGYRIEAGGLLIEHHLLEDIIYATHNETP